MVRRRFPWLSMTRACMHAGGDGGAVFAQSGGVVKFIDCEFYDNIASWASGGAISTSGKGMTNP